LSSLFFFLSLSPYLLEKKVMKDKVKEIDSLSLSLKIDLLNHTSFSFSFSHGRVIFFFLSSPEASIHLVSAFKQKKHAHGFFAVKYSYFLLKVHTLLFPFSCFPRYFSLLDFFFCNSTSYPVFKNGFFRFPFAQIPIFSGLKHLVWDFGYSLNFKA